MKSRTTFSRMLLIARMMIATLSVLTLTVPALAGSTSTDTDREANDRPADLRAIYALEDRAEAIAEGEKVGRIAIAAAREAIAEWPTVRATLAQNGASVRELSQMDTRTHELAGRLHESQGLRRAANDVTGALAPLFAIFGESIPADVHRLDYLGRSIGLDASAAQWGRASRDAYALDRAWLRLKRIVLAKANGSMVVLMFDTAVRRVRDGAHDRNANETGAGASAVANAVDAVEGLYT